ncbi:MAG TPA: hypothetical protein VLK58_26440 [Conexibacter sp.]|nr:hypothetical protein [Conexibacter sp.]
MANRTLTADWQFSAMISVPGLDVKVDGNWDAIDGGDTTSQVRRYRPGGRAQSEAMPAPSVTSDIVLERAFRGSIDSTLRNRLAGAIGRDVTVTVYPLDERGVTLTGRGETINGILKEVTRPAFRSEGEGVALFRVVVAPDGTWEQA